MKLHFIAGLPRSGSTLLAAILRQNPRITAGITSPALRIFQTIEAVTARDKEAAGALSGEVKIKLRRAVLDAMYGDADIVFDTNKLWTSKMPVLALLYPEAKVICCVRSVSWVMDSWERLFAKNPLELSALFGFRADTSVYTRVSKLASSDGLVGASLDALREAYYGPFKDRLLLIEYPHFVKHPHLSLQAIYAFIGEPMFKHDFERIEFADEAYDKAVGMPGLHSVHGPVQFVSRETILPPDLFDRFRNDAFWNRSKLPIQDRREVA